MRRLLPVLFLALIAAKGSKKSDAPPPAEPAPAAPAPAPAAEPEPAPVEAAPLSVHNADLNVTITYADGSTKAGHVKGIERTVDFSGDQGWTSDEGKLRLTVEAGTSEKQVAWKDLKSVAITPGKMPDDVDCTYSSDFTPWMYDCTIRTTSAATMKDGTKGNITNRHQWRFTMDDGSTVELQVFKYSIREQDERTVEFGDESTENFKLYTKLQDELRTDLKTKIVKSISVQ